MVDDAVDVVLAVADQWRGTDAREVDGDDVEFAYLRERLGLDHNSALFNTVVTE